MLTWTCLSTGWGSGGTRATSASPRASPPAPPAPRGPAAWPAAAAPRTRRRCRSVAILTSRRGPGGQGGQATVKVGLQSRPMFLSIYTYLVRSRSMTNHTSDISGVQYTTRIYQLIFLVFNIQQGSISNQPMNIS